MNLILNSEIKKKYKLKRDDFIVFSLFYQAMPFGGCTVNYRVISFWLGQPADYAKDIVDSLIHRGLLVRTENEGRTVLMPILKDNIETEEKINPILQFMLDNYEDKRLSTNKTLKRKYIRQWTSTADELLDACEGDIKLAQLMIDNYARQQTEEWKLWDITNNFCKLYDDLKKKHKI